MSDHSSMQQWGWTQVADITAGLKMRMSKHFNNKTKADGTVKTF